MLFLFTLQANKEKWLCAHFTFSQVEKLVDKKQSSGRNEATTTASSQLGDFMIIGSADQNKVAMIPDL